MDGLSGRVQEKPLAKILFALAARGHTGVVAVDGGGEWVEVYFRAGAIVHVECSSDDEATTGVGSDAQQTLVMRAARAFGLRDATFVVSDRAHDRGGAASIDARRTIYYSVKQHFDEPRLARELAGLDGYLVRVQDGATFDAEAYGFGAMELQLVAALAREYVSVGAAVAACRELPRAEALAAIYALATTAALDAHAVGAAPGAPAHDATGKGTPGLGASAYHVTLPSIAPDAHAQVAGAAPPPRGQTMQLSAAGAVHNQAVTGATTYRVPSHSGASSPLGGEGTALAPAHVRRQTGPVGGAVADGLRPRSQTMSMPVGGAVAGGVRPRSQTMSMPAETARMTGAHAVATATGPLDPVQALAFGVQLNAKLAAVDRGADHFALLEVPRTATRAEIKTGYFNLAKLYHPDRLAVVRMPEFRSNAERIFAALSTAFATLDDDVKRKGYLDVLGAGGTAAVRRKEDEDGARAARILAAESTYHQGEMALRRNQIPQALDHFKRALDFNGEEADHHAMYAWCVWLTATDKARVAGEVRKMLLSAVELSETCVQAHYFLGHVALELGQHSRALAKFNEVLEKNRNHVDAQREARLLQRRINRGEVGQDKGGAEKKRGLFGWLKK